MSVRMIMPTIKSEIKRSSSWQLDHLDPVLVFVCIALLSLGLVGGVGLSKYCRA